MKSVTIVLALSRRDEWLKDDGSVGRHEQHSMPKAKTVKMIKSTAVKSQCETLEVNMSVSHKPQIYAPQHPTMQDGQVRFELDKMYSHYHMASSHAAGKRIMILSKKPIKRGYPGSVNAVSTEPHFTGQTLITPDSSSTLSALD